MTTATSDKKNHGLHKARNPNILNGIRPSLLLFSLSSYYKTKTTITQWTNYDNFIKASKYVRLLRIEKKKEACGRNLPQASLYF